MGIFFDNYSNNSSCYPTESHLIQHISISLDAFNQNKQSTEWQALFFVARGRRKDPKRSKPWVDSINTSENHRDKNRCCFRLIH